MKLLNNIMSFDYYKVINEDLSGRVQRRTDEIVSSKGEVTLSSGDTINAKDIVKVVQESVYEIKTEWTSLYKFASGASIFYHFNNPYCNTMYVTENLEIHISANFVHDTLKMDKDLVMAVLMHEILHVVYDHIQRGKNWLATYGKPLNRQTQRDNNLAADIEVNATLVNKGIISYERLFNEIHGLFLRKESDDLSNNFVHVISMENILEDKEAMKKLRKMVGDDDNQSDQSGQGGESGQGEESGQNGESGQGGQSGQGEESEQGGESGQNGESGQGGQSGQKKGILDANSNSGSNKKEGEIIGEFGDSSSKKSKDIFKGDSIYTNEEKDFFDKIKKETQIRNSKSEIEKRKKDFAKSLNKNDAIRKIIEKASIDSAKYTDIWKKILEKFLSNRHRPGSKTNSSSYDWKNKHRLASKMYGINIPKEGEKDPQDVNLYVDVSLSMDTDLMSIICESLIILSEKFKYTALNIIPWATNAGSIYKIEELSKKGKDQTVKEIIGILENAPSECGGTTESSAVISSIVKGCCKTLSDKHKKTKDDVHIIITDGQVYGGFENFENDLFMYLKNEFNKDVANKALENSIWMIYDASESTKNRCENAIKIGKKIYITSELVKKAK